MVVALGTHLEVLLELGPYSALPQLLHFSHRPSGTLRFLAGVFSVRMPEGINLLSQLMRV